MLAKKGNRNAFEELLQDSKKRLEKEKQLAQQKEKIENIKAQEKSYQILFKKLEKDFDMAYSEVIKLNENGENEVKRQGTWRDLDSEDQLLELLEKLGYIDQQIDQEVKLGREISTILDQKLTRRNILVVLASFEKIVLPWMTMQEQPKQP